MQYSRDSLDRFGDDLSELLLSYLYDNDCFRFECVCKQWRRLVFKRRTTLLLACSQRLAVDNKNSIKLIASRGLDCALLEGIFRKCPSIGDVVIRGPIKLDECLSTIGAKCAALRSIEFGDALTQSKISPQCWSTFGERCGARLEELSLKCVDVECARSLLRLAPNLRAVTYASAHTNDNINAFFDPNGQHFLPKLERIHNVIYFDFRFKPFAEQYSSTLKKICITVKRAVTEAKIRDMFDELTSFARLEELDMCFDRRIQSHSIINGGLRRIGSSCVALSQLKLCGPYNYALEFGHCFTGDNFKSLRRLSIVKIHSIEGSVAFGVRCCVALTHLQLTANYVCDDNFDDIHVHASQLRSFRLSCVQRITDCTLLSLSMVSQLVFLELKVCDRRLNEITDEGVRQFVTTSRNVRRIVLSETCAASRATVDSFVERAIRNAKLNYSLSVTCISQCSEGNTSDANGVHSLADHLPANVKLSVC